MHMQSDSTTNVGIKGLLLHYFLEPAGNIDSPILSHMAFCNLSYKIKPMAIIQKYKCISGSNISKYMPCINEDLDAFLLYVLDKLILLAISCNDLLLLWNYLMLEAPFDAEGGKPE